MLVLIFELLLELLLKLIFYLPVTKPKLGLVTPGHT